MRSLSFDIDDIESMEIIDGGRVGGYAYHMETKEETIKSFFGLFSKTIPSEPAKWVKYESYGYDSYYLTISESDILKKGKYVILDLSNGRKILKYKPSVLVVKKDRNVKYEEYFDSLDEVVEFVEMVKSKSSNNFITINNYDKK